VDFGPLITGPRKEADFALGGLVKYRGGFRRRSPIRY